MFMFKNLKLFHILLRQLSFQLFKQLSENDNRRRTRTDGKTWNKRRLNLKRNQIGWCFSKAKWKQKVLFFSAFSIWLIQPILNTAGINLTSRIRQKMYLTADNWLKIITAINFLSWMSHGMSINLDKSHRGQIVLFRNSK